jgi:phosphomannomutase
MSLKFGTSGLRGLATELVDGAAGRYAVAFVKHLLAAGHVHAGDRVYVGEDLRASSPEIARQCVAALWAAGMVPVRCGALPTPALALYAASCNAAALMVSGSHIPADRNGLKFYRPDGEIDKADEQAILFFSDKTSHIPAAANDDVPVADEAAGAWALYRQRCLAILADDALAGLRVGVYQHSSVARDFLVELLAAKGATPVELGRSETFVPVDTEAVGDETVSRFREWVREHRLDAIISTDADADRPLVIDENGDQVRGDILGIIASRFLGASGVVTPVTSNSAIDRVLGVKAVRTRVGSPFVIEAMQHLAIASSGKTVVGFEANGGFLLASPAKCAGGMLAALPTRDSVVPILATLSLASTGPLSGHVEALQLPVSISDRLENFPVADSQALMARLENSVESINALLGDLGTVDVIDRTDGLRLTLESGVVIHLRPSGNAPEMRCYVEAATPETASATLKNMLAKLRP